MTAIRALVWAGVAGWLVICLNFTVGFLLRRSMVRLTFALGALGGGAFLLSRLSVLPLGVRLFLDVALAVGGVACGLAICATFARRGFRVLQ